MPIIPSDIVLRLATTAGTAGNSLAQADPNLSLGKYVSTTDVATTLHGLFDVITGAENAASDVEYRCVFVLNNHATLTLENAVVFMTAEVAGGAVAALSVDSTAVSAKGAATVQALTVADEGTAPTALTFVTTPVSAATGLALGSIPAGSVRAFWVRRSAANTAAINADGVSLNISGDTAA
jgi:hypothetical protein